MRARARAERSVIAPLAGLATIALAIGLILARLALASHWLLVPHAVCEHGDVTHAAPHSDDRADRSPAQSPDHDHCDADALAHRIDDFHAPIPAATLLSILDPEAPAAVAERRPIPLLHLAPKGSPPS
jgi:hypothetical protein